MDLETIKVNGHYVVLLMLKSKDVNPPNNTGLALGLNRLQRRLAFL